MSAFNEEYFLVCETFEVSRVYSSRAVNVIWLFAFTPVNTAERFAATLDEDPGSLGDFLTDRSDKQIRSPACFFPPLQMMILNSLGWVVKCRQLSKSKIWIHLDIRDSSADNLLKEIRCLSNSCTKTKCWNPAWPLCSMSGAAFSPRAQLFGLFLNLSLLTLQRCDSRWHSKKIKWKANLN